MYKTLFEVKLEELVRGGEKTARLIGEAADKCTQVRSNAALLVYSSAFNGDYALDSDACFRCVGVSVYALPRPRRMGSCAWDDTQ